MRTQLRHRYLLAIVVVLLVGLIEGCGEYSVPITDHPTRGVDAQLIGEWITADGVDRIKIRALTSSTYVVSYNGILFRAHHSDVANVPFISAQELETRNRAFSYLAYRVSQDGRLYLRLVNADVISDETRDSRSVQTLLKMNLQNSSLFYPEAEFRKLQ